MGNGLKSPYHLKGAISYGVTQEGRTARGWKCGSKPVGGLSRQIRTAITPRGDGEGESPQTVLNHTAEKNLYASPLGDRTANRHR